MAEHTAGHAVEHAAQPEISEYAKPEVSPLKWKIIGEAFDSYIIVQDGEDILFIDKHAAHERILFEKLSAEENGSAPQLLIEPAVLQFDRDELDMLLSNSDLLGGMGFEYEAFGGDSIILRGMPGEIDRADAAASLQEIAASLAENRRAPITQRREEALRLVVCKAALKAGSISSYAEKYALVQRVMEFEDIKYCPHGRPVAAVLKKYELEKRFGRT
jgi:DNA mismatch repair protein MutL